MATTPEASDADLRNRLRGEPGVTPEDTRSELLQDGQDKVLRDNLRGVPGVAPEDTHSELLAEKAKDERKAQIDFLIAGTRAEQIHQIGHVVVLFRRNADEPKIALPR